MPARIRLRFEIAGRASLESHGILDRHHARDTARDLDRPINACLRADKTAQLNHALEGFDIDLSRFQRRLAKDCRLHFGSNDGVVQIFSGSCLLCGRSASQERSEKTTKTNVTKRLNTCMGLLRANHNAKGLARDGKGLNQFEMRLERRHGILNCFPAFPVSAVTCCPEYWIAALIASGARHLLEAERTMH